MRILFVCTIFSYGSNVFKKWTVCKIVRDLLSFFPPHLFAGNPESKDLGCLLSRVFVELTYKAFLSVT
jgi:hypothetical protein